MTLIEIRNELKIWLEQYEALLTGKAAIHACNIFGDCSECEANTHRVLRIELINFINESWGAIYTQALQSFSRDETGIEAAQNYADAATIRLLENTDRWPLPKCPVSLEKLRDYFKERAA